VPAADLAEGLCRREIAGFPELSEVDVVRHFTRLSTWNYGVDSGFYPLGSCTMKYNPRSTNWRRACRGWSISTRRPPTTLPKGRWR